MPILWMDMETSGLDTINDKLLEIAVVITDDKAEEKIVYDGPNYVSYSKSAVEDIKNNADYKVRYMHSVSGLWDDLKNASPLDDESASVANMDFRLVDFISEAKHETNIFKDKSELYLGGTSVLLDRIIMNRDLPMTASMVHYHSIDVSTIETMCSVNPNFPLFAREHRFNKSHRAMDDVLEAIEMYRYYMNSLGIF